MYSTNAISLTFYQQKAQAQKSCASSAFHTVIFIIQKLETTTIYHTPARLMLYNKLVTLIACFARILMNCGIVEEMKSVFEDTLDLKIKKNTKTIIISGSRDTVKATFENIKKNLKV